MSSPSSGANRRSRVGALTVTLAAAGLAVVLALVLLGGVSSPGMALPSSASLRPAAAHLETPDGTAASSGTRVDGVPVLTPRNAIFVGDEGEGHPSRDAGSSEDSGQGAPAGTTTATTTAGDGSSAADGGGSRSGSTTTTTAASGTRGGEDGSDGSSG